MKFIKGGIQEVAQESITSQLLIEAGVNNPDFVPTMMRLYKDNFMLNHILDVKKMKTDGLSMNTNDGNYRTVSSNHIKYRIAETDFRVEKFRSNDAGVTFIDELGSTDKPGQFQSIVTVYSNTNWMGYKEIAELGDNETQIWAISDPIEHADGIFETKIKLVTNNHNDYILPELLEDGAEFYVATNAHEQDFSERGVEKYSFKSWGDTYLSLMRFKYSWSGTAAAMMKNKASVKGRFVEHNGQTLFLRKAEMEMFQRASKQINFAHMFGKGTVSVDGKIITKDLGGREVMMGDGIYNSNGGPIRIPYNGWTKEFIEYFISEIDNYVNGDIDSHREVYLAMAPMAYMSFQHLMSEFGKTANNNVVGDGSSKGINDTYAYYEIGGIRLIAHKEPSMTRRARTVSPDGTFINDWDCVVLPLGLTDAGTNGVELVQLRPMTGGTVAGVDEGGNIASSVDGSSKHILFQNGVINQNKVFIIRKPRLVK